MKSNRGRTKCSTLRFVLSFLCVTSFLRSVASSTNFLNFSISRVTLLLSPVVSSPWCRGMCMSVSTCHSPCCFVVSFRPFDCASLGTRKGVIRTKITELYEVVDFLGNVANLSKEPPPECTIHFQPRKRTGWWEWEYSELSHYTFWRSDIFSFSLSLFYVPTELESLFLRPCQLIVAVRVDEGSLQKRLFEVTGCREHGPGNRRSKGNARALYLEHHFTPMKIAHDSYFLCRRKCYPVYLRTGRRALISNKCTPNLPARW